jgi:predicted ATP-grasp superfamily ATP-dependent carboligase
MPSGMTLYRFVQDPPPALEAPVLLTALEGWVDAGGAATGLANHLGGEPFAIFDTDEVLDYRARRPILDVVDGVLRELTWPELVVRRVHADRRDLLILSGPEPDQRWRAFAAAVLDLCLRTGVVEVIAIGAIPFAVPHTRPTPVMSSATSRELLSPDDPTPEGFLRVPAAAISVVEMAVAEHGIPARGFFAQVPHYVGATYTPAVQALLERLGRHLGVTFDAGSLPEEAGRLRRQLEEILESRPEVKEYVERLEAVEVPEQVPSGDEIAAEIERFLRREDSGPDR